MPLRKSLESYEIFLYEENVSAGLLYELALKIMGATMARNATPLVFLGSPTQAGRALSRAPHWCGSK